MGETWIDRMITEAIEAGDLEPHEGVGERIPDLDRAYDPNWWVKDWVEREKLREYERDEREKRNRRE